jgi:hypothetical protein
MLRNRLISCIPSSVADDPPDRRVPRAYTRPADVGSYLLLSSVTEYRFQRTFTEFHSIFRSKIGNNLTKFRQIQNAVEATRA